MKKLTIFFLAACLAAAVLAVSAFAAGVVFVDGTVAAAGDGTSPASPLKTFASAVQAVKTGGGTIVLCGDTEIRAAVLKWRLPPERSRSRRYMTRSTMTRIWS